MDTGGFAIRTYYGGLSTTSAPFSIGFDVRLHRHNVQYNTRPALQTLYICAPFSIMDCASSFSLGSYDDELDGQATGADSQLRPVAVRKRRPSNLTRQKSIVNHILEGEEGILLKVGYLELSLW